MNKLPCTFICCIPLLIGACDRAKETTRVEEKTETSGKMVLEDNKPAKTLPETAETPAEKPTKKQAHQVPTTTEQPGADPPPLKLDLKVTDLLADEEGQSDLSAKTETESAGEFDHLFQPTSKEKKINITSDVFLAEDADDTDVTDITDIRVEDIIEKIDGAEVQLEYKF